MAESFDFIIVGGGTAGCLLAHRLSHALARPKVLLVEAGSKAEGQFLLEPFHRYTPSVLRPDLDHGFNSTPQKALNDRVIAYTRGKGLGGSSNINFAVYLYGSADDYNEWAELVGDDSWAWEQTQQSFKTIENYDFSSSEQWSHLAKPDAAAHGKDGEVKLCLPQTLEQGFGETMEALQRNGEKINLDPNSGDPIGISIFPATYSKSGRTTSANAHLANPPTNLTIWTGSPMKKLEFVGTRVVGVETADGRRASSRVDTILCGGSIDTPKMLMLNGIGPTKELEKLNIPVVKDLPGVGKHLRDHVLSFLCVEIDSKHNNRYGFETSESQMAEAVANWEKDKTGNLALYNSGLWGGFLKLPGLEDLPEYKALDPNTQRFLSQDKTPTYEIIGNCLLFPPGTQLSEGSSYLTSVAFLMNAQSEGAVTLRSADPEDKPEIELNFLQHPYDKRVFREAIRQTWTKVYENPEIKPLIKSHLFAPKSLSDEDVDAFMKDATSTVWHANGTAMMGKPENPQACVDTSFRVYGIQGLRVADLSVCPLTPNNHTQATAYLVGQKAAEKLIKEYGLDRHYGAKL